MVGIVGLVVATLALAPAADASAESVAAQDMQAAVVGTAQQLRDSLKDSQSARFRNVYLRTTTGTDGKFHQGVCGEINARNSYGGYGGWVVFFGDASQLIVGERLGLEAATICRADRGTSWRKNDLSQAMARMVTAP